MSKATQKYLASLILFGSNGIVASMIDLPSLFIVLAHGEPWAPPCWWPWSRSLAVRTNLQAPKHPRQALYLAVSGAALGVAWLFLFEAYRYVGVGVASLLFYCGPVIVMALSPMLFKTRLTAQKVLGFAAVTVGAFLVVGQGLGEGVSPWGLFLGAMSAVMYAVMVIFSKKVTQNRRWSAPPSSFAEACRRCYHRAFCLQAPSSYRAPRCSPTSTCPRPSASASWSTRALAATCTSRPWRLPVTRVAVCGCTSSRSAGCSALLLGEAMTPANVLGRGPSSSAAPSTQSLAKLRLRAAGNRHGHRVGNRLSQNRQSYRHCARMPHPGTSHLAPRRFWHIL